MKRIYSRGKELSIVGAVRIRGDAVANWCGLFARRCAGLLLGLPALLASVLESTRATCFKGAAPIEPRLLSPK
jgi:hypothetical protein